VRDCSIVASSPVIGVVVAMVLSWVRRGSAAPIVEIRLGMSTQGKIAFDLALVFLIIVLVWARWQR
jgi:hypothetical protein